MGLLPAVRSNCHPSLCTQGLSSPQPLGWGAGPGAAEAVFPGGGNGAGGVYQMERAQGQASRDWQEARATAPGQPQLLAPCTRSLGKRGASVPWAPGAAVWPGASRPRATRSIAPDIAPGTALYIMGGGGCARLQAAPLRSAGGVPAGEAPGSLCRLRKQEIHKWLLSPFRE